MSRFNHASLSQSHNNKLHPSRSRPHSKNLKPRQKPASLTRLTRTDLLYAEPHHERSSTPFLTSPKSTHFGPHLKGTMCVRFTRRYAHCLCPMDLEAQSFEFCEEALFRYLGVTPRLAIDFRNLKKGISKKVWKAKMLSKVELLSPEWRKRIILYRHRCAEELLEEKDIPERGYFKDGWCGIHRPDPESRPGSHGSASSTGQEDINEVARANDLQEDVSFGTILRFYSGSPSPPPPPSPSKSLETVRVRSPSEESADHQARATTPTITLTSPAEDVENLSSYFNPGMIGQAITTSATITLFPGSSIPAAIPTEPELQSQDLTDLEPITSDRDSYGPSLAEKEGLRKVRSEKKLCRFYGSDVAAADVGGIFSREPDNVVMRRPASSNWLRGI